MCWSTCSQLFGINTRLSGELLLLCGYVLKLNSVRKQSPGMVRILPYIDKLFQGEDVEKVGSGRDVGA